MRGCYLSVSDGCGENGYHAPEHSPHNYFDFDYTMPYETSQEAKDCLLNHNDVLAEENQKLRHQLQEQNAAHGRQAHNDILWVALPFFDAE